MTLPKTWHISAHIMFIEEALNDSMILDFLSDKARRSIAILLAQRVQDFYNFWDTATQEQKDEAYGTPNHEYDNYDFFYREVKKHPLGDLLGDSFARSIHKIVHELYARLEKEAKA